MKSHPSRLPFLVKVSFVQETVSDPDREYIRNPRGKSGRPEIVGDYLNVDLQHQVDTLQHSIQLQSIYE